MLSRASTDGASLESSSLSSTTLSWCCTPPGNCEFVIVSDDDPLPLVQTVNALAVPGDGDQRCHRSPPDLLVANIKFDVLTMLYVLVIFSNPIIQFDGMGAWGTVAARSRVEVVAEWMEVRERTDMSIAVGKNDCR